MRLEFLKLIVQPIVLERDDATGAVVGERLGEATALYSFEQLAEYREAIERELLAQQANGNGKENGSDAGHTRTDDRRQVR